MSDEGVLFILPYLFGGLILAASVYAAFAEDLLNISLALLVQMVSLGGILLCLGQDYCAILALFFGVLGPFLVVSLLGTAHGSPRLEEMYRLSSSKNSILRVFGFVACVGFGVLVAKVFSELPIMQNSIDLAKVNELSKPHLGNSLLGEQALVLELFAVLSISLLVGVGILLRKAKI